MYISLTLDKISRSYKRVTTLVPGPITDIKARFQIDAIKKDISMTRSIISSKSRQCSSII